MFTDDVKKALSDAMVARKGLEEIRSLLDAAMDSIEEATERKVVCRVRDWTIVAHAVSDQGTPIGYGPILFVCRPSAKGYPIAVYRVGEYGMAPACPDKAALEARLHEVMSHPETGMILRKLMWPREWNEIGTSQPDHASEPAPPIATSAATRAPRGRGRRSAPAGTP